MAGHAVDKRLLASSGRIPSPFKVSFLTCGALLLAALAGTLPVAASASATDLPLDLELTLAECVRLAVQNNRSLAGQRLARLAQKITLDEAEEEFQPIFTFTPYAEAGVDSLATASNWLSSFGAGFTPKMTLNIPTGGNIEFTWDNKVANRKDDSYSADIMLKLTQPLMRGAGADVATVNLRSARRQEHIYILSLKDTAIGIVTRAITTYRSLIQASRRVEISARSLQRAQELLAMNQKLIRAGRMAEQDIVQTQANIAERELSLTEARNALDNARLALIDVLDIDSGTRIRPTETLDISPVEPDEARSLKLAMKNRPNYLIALLGTANLKDRFLVAEDDRRWGLSFESSARYRAEGRSISDTYENFDEGQFRAGLILDVPLGQTDLDLRRLHERAGIALRINRLHLAELRNDIEIDVRNAVREVEIDLRRAELARQAREFAEQKLEIEQTKFRTGLSTNFQLVRFEDDLVNSETSEVGAIIAYLNSLTSLDRTLGTTLQTWGIDIDKLATGPEVE